MRKILLLFIIMFTIFLISCGKDNATQKTAETIETIEYSSSDEMGLNPILPLYEYIPDGEPHVFGDRVYLYGSHDKFNEKTFCVNDYVVYSASVSDLTDWTFEGYSYSKEQDPRYEERKGNYLYAPDVAQGKDGKYYLFYCLNPHPEIGVAVSDTPAGPFEYYGLVKHSDGTILGQGENDLIQFDPGIFIDDDGSIYLYSGNAQRYAGSSQNQGSQVMQLEDDMLTLKSEPEMLLCDVNNSEGTGFEGHEFFEASSMRKINDTYYLIYSSVNLHELCYAYSDSPDKDFKYGGVIISNANIFSGDDLPLNSIGNNHGSLVCLGDQWYIFYHRHTNANSYSRQACAERICIKDDGSIPQVEVTTTGLSSVSGKTNDWISAGRACNLSTLSEYDDDILPYVTQQGRDREDTAASYVTNITDQSLIGFKYFNCNNLDLVSVSVQGNFSGTLEIRDEITGETKGTIHIAPTKEWTVFSSEIKDMSGDSAIYFIANGEGTLNFEKFRMEYTK